MRGTMGRLAARKGRARLPKITVLDSEDRWSHTAEDEFLWWPRIQWIDPGTVSGVAVIWFDPVAVFAGQTMAKCVLAYAEQFLSGPENGPNGQINRYLRMRKALSGHPGLAVGIESFTIRQFNQDYEFLAPVRIRAGIESRMSMMNPQPVLHAQNPNDALNTYTNDRLTALRMYTPGPDHVNDAKRHALLWIRRLRSAGREAFISAHGDEQGWWEAEQ